MPLVSCWPHDPYLKLINLYHSHIFLPVLLECLFSMVYVDNKKFACASCIKGHRSSACNHADRPLFEVKKKGRPVSQCTKCRELRQSKKLHSKCTCDHKGDDAPLMQPLSTSPGSKPRRFIPIIPALPNGLKDVIAASQSSTSLTPDSRKRVDSLLNPSSASSSVPSVQNLVPSGDLVTLARAAAMESSSPDADSGPSSNTIDSSRHHSRPATPANIALRKRQKHSASILARTPGPDLAPLLFPSSSSSPPSIPDFPSMPSMSEISSLAGSGCTCGVRCACPGCVEHTNSGDDTGKRCGEGCGACIDHSIEALPGLIPSQAKESTSFLDRFFAQAAALPPPPTHRKMNSYNLDPMNKYISPQSSGSQPFTPGVVNLPKLKCCGDPCTCPAGQCTCGDNCVGACLVTCNRNQAEGTQTSTLNNTLPVQRKHQGTCCGGSV